MRGEMLLTFANQTAPFTAHAYSLFSRWAELGEGLLDGLASYGLTPSKVSWEAQRSGEYQVACSLEFGVVRLHVGDADFDASFAGPIGQVTPHPLDVAMLVAERLRPGLRPLTHRVTLSGHLKLENATTDDLFRQFAPVSVGSLGRLRGLSWTSEEGESELGGELERSQIYPGPETVFLRVRSEWPGEFAPSRALVEAIAHADDTLQRLGIDSSFGAKN